MYSFQAHKQFLKFLDKFLHFSPNQTTKTDTNKSALKSTKNSIIRSIRKFFIRKILHNSILTHPEHSINIQQPLNLS
jgi:hypothetical protein